MADRKATTPSPAQRRFGYLVSIAVNAVLLWCAHRILDWGWLPFLTQAWTQVLPLVTASLVTAIAVNALFLGYDGVWLKAPGNVLLAAFGIAVSVRMWRVFPFDFSGYAFGWATVARVLVVLSIVGSAIAIVVELGKLFRAAASGSDERPVPAGGAWHDEPPRDEATPPGA